MKFCSIQAGKRFGVLLIALTPSLLFAQSEKTLLDSSQYQLHFQQTIIAQYKPSMPAKYSGKNSLSAAEEAQTSLTATFFTGLKMGKKTWLYFNPEIAGGSGLSSALGVAGFPNGETFRIGNPKPQVYIARFYVDHFFAFGSEREENENGINQQQVRVPLKYLRLVAGKYSVADFFDCNSYSHDPRMQFMNWSLMSNGAWDYPANTRGYTWGVLTELRLNQLYIRAGAHLVPETANGSKLDNRLPEALAATTEIQKIYRISGRRGALRMLLFLNHANMGNYKQAVDETMPDSIPNLVATRSHGRVKFGFGLNWEQEISENAGLFARLSWNDGKNETWAFTEIDRSISVGYLLNFTLLGRPNDELGIACVVNGISTEHQNFLKRGGTGFMLGDGTLRYGPETIGEIFYNLDLHNQHFWLSPGYQFILHPGYNQDRGPAHVFSIRVHTEF